LVGPSAAEQDIIRHRERGTTKDAKEARPLPFTIHQDIAMTEPARRPVAVHILSAREAREHVGALAEVLVDCVDGGASVSFMAPLARARAEAFWREVADGVATGDRILVIATDEATDTLLGTVQVVFARPENQPHRADVAKMLVRRSARRRGVGAALMRAAVEAALAAGKTLLVLDTVTGGDAERLYARLGWTRAGVIPRYALMPDGRPCDTTVFYRDLARGLAGARPT
jgi:GNAT superfamily N-acetyltransferase